MYLVYNRFSLIIVYCINLFEAQPSFISKYIYIYIYIEYLWKKKIVLGFDTSHECCQSSK